MKLKAGAEIERNGAVAREQPMYQEYDKKMVESIRRAVMESTPENLSKIWGVPPQTISRRIARGCDPYDAVRPSDVTTFEWRGGYERIVKAVHKLTVENKGQLPSVRDIGKLTGLNHSLVFRHLRELVSRKILTKTESGKFSLMSEVDLRIVGNPLRSDIGPGVTGGDAYSESPMKIKTEIGHAKTPRSRRYMRQQEHEYRKRQVAVAADETIEDAGVPA